ncbi:MAG: adenosylcobinamide-GDP ribazoletransferase [Candidatus Hydrogenedentes bacterium]|nr:adenosylcobinamide-GDP ribazoletransferase [Candidatus Hydrogenedentota bacterium]
MRSFLAAAQFLTILPIRTSFDTAEIGRSTPYFPVVGLLIGGAVAALDHYVFNVCFPPAISAMLSVIALAAASGALHLDGLADTADGFLSSRPKERILAIMRDSRIGTMGAIALIAILGLKVAALASTADALRWRALMLAPIAGRCMLLAAMTRAPYARPDGGLAGVYLSYRKTWHALFALIVFAAAAYALMNWRGLLIAAGCIIVTITFNAYSRRKIGGITGDTLGAVCELVETFVLLAALEIPV